MIGDFFASSRYAPEDLGIHAKLLSSGESTVLFSRKHAGFGFRLLPAFILIVPFMQFLQFLG
jgi:hypothetical protein